MFTPNHKGLLGLPRQPFIELLGLSMAYKKELLGLLLCCNMEL